MSWLVSGRGARASAMSAMPRLAARSVGARGKTVRIISEMRGNSRPRRWRKNARSSREWFLSCHGSPPTSGLRRGPRQSAAASEVTLMNKSTLGKIVLTAVVAVSGVGFLVKSSVSSAQHYMMVDDLLKSDLAAWKDKE